MYENEYFKQYIRWAIYTIAKFALCQLNMCAEVVLGITEYAYVCKETNNLIKHINYHLKQDEEFLTASKMFRIEAFLELPIMDITTFSCSNRSSATDSAS